MHKLKEKEIIPNSVTEKTLAYNGINKNDKNLSKDTAKPNEKKFNINSFISLLFLQNVRSTKRNHIYI